MTTTFTLSRDDIITMALRKVGVLDLTSSASATQLTVYSQLLNVMLKAWQSKGIKIWTINEYAVSLTANKNTYIISPTGPDVTANKPLKVIQAWLRNNQTTPALDIPMRIISRQEYNILSSKATTGITNSVLLIPGTSSSTLKVWLSPDTNVQTNYSLWIVVQEPIADVLSNVQTSFPQEWMQALVWNLAAEIGMDVGLSEQRLSLIEAKAQQYKTEMEDWDVEAESTFFAPDYRSTYK